MSVDALFLACQCGATLTGTVQGARTWDTVADLTDAFWSLHQGDGHGEATFAEARNARRRDARGTTVDTRGAL